MISYPAALDLITRLALAPRQEDVPLGDAAGLVLAQDVVLGGDLPAFDRSAMDGFAIHAEVGRSSYPIVGTVAAGAAWVAPFPPGCCVRIMTGASVPVGGTVVPWERAREQDGAVVVADPADRAPGRNIAWRGEDGRAGARVMVAGTILSPVLVALAAMAGAGRLRVMRPPTVAVITTGDELGTIVNDCNGPLLAALATTWRCPAVADHAGDTGEALAAALARAASAQVIVTTGGVGGSERDLVLPAARAAGFSIVLYEVAMQPGKPVLLMRHDDGRVLVGLPGNPVSVLATAHLILRVVLKRLGAPLDDGWTTQPLAQAHQARGKRLLFRPAHTSAAGLVLVPWNGSGDLCAAAAGEGLVEIPSGVSWQAGELVRFLPYAGTVPGHYGVLPR